MKLSKLFLGLIILALGVARAESSYKVILPMDTLAGDTQLKAGTYKLQVDGNQASFAGAKETIKVAASMEQAPSKFKKTSLETSGTKLQAIDIGGTTMRIVFKSSK